MMSGVRTHARRFRALIALLVVGLWVAGCGSSSDPTTTGPLPGTGRPPVTIGDKNFTEQFVLGELYDLALTAQGYSVVLNPNIGPIAVSFQALTSGRLDMYPEYVDVWNTFVAGYKHGFPSAHAAIAAARAFAKTHGLVLLRPTPFSDTNAVTVTHAYATAHGLNAIGDLRELSGEFDFGAPAQFQYSSVGLTPIERAYGFTPRTVTTLNTGAQYQALTTGAVQAAWMTTTDGELAGATFTMLRDPQHVFGYGNALPVVPAKVLAAEGPDFRRTINRVTRLLTLKVMRRLNAEVELGNETPAVVAKQFLQAHGLVPRDS